MVMMYTCVHLASCRRSLPRLCICPEGWLKGGRRALEVFRDPVSRPQRLDSSCHMLRLRGWASGWLRDLVCHAKPLC